MQKIKLVVDAQKAMEKWGLPFTYHEMLNELIKDNFIDKNGNPTKWALENGLVTLVNLSKDLGKACLIGLVT